MDLKRVTERPVLPGLGGGPSLNGVASAPSAVIFVRREFLSATDDLIMD